MAAGGGRGVEGEGTRGLKRVKGRKEREGIQGDRGVPDATIV